MDTKIDDYDKKVTAKFAEIIDSTENIQELAAEADNAVKDAEQKIIKNTEKIKVNEDQIFEAMQKYGRVARQANELGEKVEELEKKVNKGGVLSPSDFEDKPLKVDDMPGQDKFDMTDIFKNFNGNFLEFIF